MPNIPSDLQYILDVNICNMYTGRQTFDFNSFTRCKSGYNDFYDFENPPATSTIYGSNMGLTHTQQGPEDIYVSFLVPMLTINVTSGENNTVIATYSNYGRGMIAPIEVTGALYLHFTMSNNGYPVSWVTTDQYQAPQTNFISLSDCINYIYENFANITLYVDGELWVGEPTYNWQSVPSISGKNGILSLATLKEESINDGEPVSGAAVSVFDQNPVSGNNVKDIVDGNTPLIPSAVDVTAAFIISNPPVGELASRILAAKKGSIPESIEDADKTVSIPANASNVTMPGLDENSQYYFAIFVADATGDTAVSDPKDIYTSADEGWSFDYTGEIQTFVAPKTGIYQLETWGAQGDNATDGTNSARGGYGAYAVGEVFLTQGDTLYINVGGQNGYGGGGASLEWVTLEDLIKTSDMTHYKSSNTWSWGDLDQYFNTDWNLALLPQSQSRLLTKSGEEYVYAYKDDTSHYAFCLSQIRRIKGLKFDCSIRYSSYSPYAIGMIDCLKSSSGNLIDVGLLGIVYNSSAGTYDYNVTDTNYHTYEKIFTNSVEVDYIDLIGVAGEIKFKNIMFLIET